MSNKLVEKKYNGGVTIKKKLLVLIIFSITVLLFTSYSFAENNAETPKEIVKKESIQENNKIINDNNNLKTVKSNNATKQKTNIKVTSNKTFKIGKRENITVKVFDEKNKSVTTGKVVVKVNNNSIGYGRLVNGTFTTEYLYEGYRNSFDLSVIYGNNNKYYESRYNETFKVQKLLPKLEIVNSSMVIDPVDGLKVQIKGTDPNGKPMLGRMFMKKKYC